MTGRGTGMLHSRLLRYIDEVARCGSIRAAGERLHVAPSAINKHVLLLEEAIGEPLFERLPRGLRLTPAGEVLIAHVRLTLKEFRRVEAEIRGLKTLQGGEVIVATMDGLASGIVPKAAVTFSARYPQIKIRVRVLSGQDIVDAVADGTADLGFGFNLPRAPQLENLWETDTSLGAAMSPSHPLAEMDALALAHCISFPLIFADRSMRMHGIVSRAFADAGLAVEPAFLSNSIEAMKGLAKAGEGIAFLCRFDVAEECRQGVLTYRPIRDHTFAKNMLSVVRRDKQGHGLASELFVEEIVSALGAISS